MVIAVDHVGVDQRVWFHGQALLEAGLHVLVLDPGAQAAPEMLDAFFAILAAVRGGSASLSPPPSRVAILGFGTAGEAALLAAHEDEAEPRLGRDGPRFDAHVALYPTCGPVLSSALAAAPSPTSAPLLLSSPGPR